MRCRERQCVVYKVGCAVWLQTNLFEISFSPLQIPGNSANVLEEWGTSHIVLVLFFVHALKRWQMTPKCQRTKTGTTHNAYLPLITALCQTLNLEH